MGKGVRAKRKLLLEMSAACKGGRNVHELFFPPCLGQGGKKSFEQKLPLSGTALLSATVHACGKQRKFPLIALQLIGRGSEQLLAARVALQAAAWQAAWQGVGLLRVVAFGGQWPGKLVASAWQARGKLVASGPFLWQALVAAIWEVQIVCVFNISGLENPAQVPFV